MYKMWRGEHQAQGEKWIHIAKSSSKCLQTTNTSRCVQNIEPDLEEMKLRNEDISKENETLKDRCEYLYEQLQEATAAKKKKLTRT